MILDYICQIGMVVTDICDGSWQIMKIYLAILSGVQ